MRTTLFRLAVALATFGLGVTLVTLWLGRTSCKAPVNVREATYRASERAVLAPLPPVPPLEAIPPAPPAVETLETETCEGSAAGRTVSGGVINGKAISKPAPMYPAVARAARTSGTVVVRVTVDECGDVEQAEAILGPPLLREAATEAAYKSRFSPTRVSGEPVKVTGMITYNFVLE